MTLLWQVSAHLDFSGNNSGRGPEHLLTNISHCSLHLLKYTSHHNFDHKLLVIKVVMEGYKTFQVLAYFDVSNLEHEQG